MTERYGRSPIPEAGEVDSEIIDLACELEVNLEIIKKFTRREMTRGRGTGAEEVRVKKALKQYIKEEFLPISCEGDEAKFHQILLYSARTRIYKAVKVMIGHMECDEVKGACQSLGKESSTEEVQNVFRAVGKVHSEKFNFRRVAIEFFTFRTNQDTFTNYPYSLIPPSKEIAAISDHMHDFAHDFERIGIGIILLFGPDYIDVYCDRVKDKIYMFKFYRDNLEDMRKSSLFIMQILSNAIDGNDYTADVDFKELVSVTRSALHDRLGIQEGRSPGIVNASFDSPESSMIIENANINDLFVLLYNLGKNPGLLLHQHLELNEKGNVNFTAKKLKYQGDEYVAIRVQDTAGGISPREIFGAKKRQLQMLAKDGNEDAAEELLTFDKWKYCETTIEEIYNYMFERCVTGKAVADAREMRGSGLGLDMVRNILQKHRGRVFVTDSTVESDDGSGGAVFLILLPLKAEAVGFSDPLDPTVSADVPRAIEAELDAA